MYDLIPFKTIAQQTFVNYIYFYVVLKGTNLWFVHMVRKEPIIVENSFTMTLCFEHTNESQIVPKMKFKCLGNTF